MPIKTFKRVPTDLADWDRYLRTVPVDPDDGSVTTTKLADKAVTNEKFRDSVGTSVVGRAAGTSGSAADIPAPVDDVFLVRRSGALGFGGLLDADIPATLARDTEVTAAIAAHEALPDPHPVYALDTDLAAKFETGTFTGTLTGCTTTPTATVRYSRAGQLVTIYLPQLNATSNTTAMTITGAPAAIYPARAQQLLARLQDNSVVVLGTVSVGTGGTFTFGVGVSGGVFTGSGTKGAELQSFTYSLD